MKADTLYGSPTRRPPGLRYAVNGQRVSMRTLAERLGMSRDALRSWMRRAASAGIPHDEAPQWVANRCADRYRCDI